MSAALSLVYRVVGQAYSNKNLWGVMSINKKSSRSDNIETFHYGVVVSAAHSLVYRVIDQENSTEKINGALLINKKSSHIENI